MTKPTTPTSEFHQSKDAWFKQFAEAGKEAHKAHANPKFDRATAAAIPGRLAAFFKLHPELAKTLEEAGVDAQFFAGLAELGTQLTKDTAEQLPDLRYWTMYTDAQRDSLTRAGVKVASLRKSVSAACVSLRNSSLQSQFGIGQDFQKQSLSSIRSAIKAMLSGMAKEPKVRLQAGIGTATLDQLRALETELAGIDTSRFGSALEKGAVSKELSSTVLAIENALHVYRARVNSAFSEDETAAREALSPLPRATDRRGHAAVAAEAEASTDAQAVG